MARFTYSFLAYLRTSCGPYVFLHTLEFILRHCASKMPDRSLALVVRGTLCTRYTYSQHVGMYNSARLRLLHLARAGLEVDVATSLTGCLRIAAHPKDQAGGVPTDPTYFGSQVTSATAERGVALGAWNRSGRHNVYIKSPPHAQSTEKTTLRRFSGT